MKRYAIAVMVLLLAAVRPAFGVVLLTKDAALKEVFGAAEVVTETKTLTAAQIAAVKEEAGGKWTLYQASGAAAAAGDEVPPVEFHFATTDGKRTGVALVEVQPGKWGPVTYIVALDMTGKVTNAAVMSYTEQRGRPISTKRFLGQFIGKTKASPVMVGRDIAAVSGATISSRATAFAVKKVLALYDVAFSALADEGE